MKYHISWEFQDDFSQGEWLTDPIYERTCLSREEVLDYIHENLMDVPEENPQRITVYPV